MQYRPIHRDEWEAAERISSIAFWYPIDPVKIRESVEKDPDMTHETTRAAIDEQGKLVAKIELIPFHIWFDGQQAGMGGIGGVASRPETRRGGHIRRLMTEALAEMNEQGMTFSYLYPFSYAFYGKFGYDPSAGFARITAPLEPLLACPVEGELIEYYPGEPVAPFMQVYDSFAQSRNLLVVRDEARFKYHLKHDPEASGVFTWLYRSADGTPKGYITYTQGPDNGMDVKDMAWTDKEGLVGLMGLMGRFTGNKARVRMPVLPGFVPEVFWKNLHVIKSEEQFGGMNRIVNAERAFALCRKPWFSGSCTVEVQDATCPWNTGSYRIEWGDGGQQVTRTRQPGDIVLTANALSAMVTGRLTLQELGMLDQVEIRGNETMLQALFPRKGSCIQDYF